MCFYVFMIEKTKNNVRALQREINKSKAIQYRFIAIIIDGEETGIAVPSI